MMGVGGLKYKDVRLSLRGRKAVMSVNDGDNYGDNFTIVVLGYTVEWIDIYVRGVRYGTLNEGNFWLDKVYKIEYFPVVNGIGIKIDGEVEVA